MTDKIIRIQEDDSEADTCRKEVLPKLYKSQWTDDLILEQRTFTDGKIIVVGRKARRKKSKRFDYLLRYSQNFPIAIVEAKKKYKSAGDGIQQAKDYAQILGLNFAYSTNGTEIIEFDFLTGLENKLLKFPSPSELFSRLKKSDNINSDMEKILLKPFLPQFGESFPRYYKTIAINRATKAILEGKKKCLITLATGTGKTSVAFQIIYKLWTNRWNLKGEYRRPKILFLADRSVLITDPHAKDFSIFGDARCLVPEEGLPSSREIYFSTYQSLAEDNNRMGAFRSLSRDFFDLIVIDECHRGSSSDDSNWRIILDYFSSSVHLGLTATPLREDNKDTYEYFGNPVYTYSLKQGIDDGFLAPYLVHRIVTATDATGFRPEAGQLDDNGIPIPDGVYTTPDFENLLSYLPRTKAVVKHLFNFMNKNGRFDKTIVFCVDQNHADQFRREISNLNLDLVQQYPDYAVRIVSDEGDIGKGHLSRFMDIDEPMPVVVTTSKLLSTGVDIPTCKNIVIFRMINSMTEFKQIVGRGTRVREDKEKLFFTILDYTGSATRNFADSDFDGVPPLIAEDKIDDDGEIKQIDVWTPPEVEEDGTNGVENTEPESGGNTDGPKRTKYYLSTGEEVAISAEIVQILDSNGKLKTIQFTQYAKEQITTMFPSANDFRNKWFDLEARQFILEGLENNGISIDQLIETTKLKDMDAFDILCFVAFDLKPLTRRQRVEILKRNKSDFFTQHSEKAQEVLKMILEKYVDYGLNQIHPSIIAVDPITEYGNSTEIVSEFGGFDNFINSINSIQTFLYLDA